MKFFKTRFAWAVYILGAALVFLYVLFPSELAKEYVANLIRRMHPGLTMEIGRLKLGFPPALRLYDVSLYHSGQTVADLENLKITPNILSLYLADADLAGIQIGQVEALWAFTTHRLSGILDGTVALTTREHQQALTGDLILTDGKIEFSPPLLSQRELTFDSIEAQLIFNGRSLTIEHCELMGNQLDGEVAGSIRLGQHSSTKVLDLTGNVRPHAELLARLGSQVPKLLENQNLQTEGVPFKIKGPMGSPTYSFY